MEPKDASHAIRYFFEGDFLPHRKAFTMRRRSMPGLLCSQRSTLAGF